MRDIGDRHDQSPAAPLLLAKNSIVEIARCFAVNGDQRQITQIFTPDQIRLLDLVRQRLVFFQCRFGKLKRQIVFA